MARGLDKHNARIDALNMLGRDLARRSRSKCELCETGSVSLKPLEITPIPEEPELDHTLFICEECRQGIESGKPDQKRWRFLESVIWSETPVIQVAAVRVTRILQQQGVDWAATLMDTVYLSPEIEEWLGLPFTHK